MLLPWYGARLTAIVSPSVMESSSTLRLGKFDFFRWRKHRALSPSMLPTEAGSAKPSTGSRKTSAKMEEKHTFATTSCLFYDLFRSLLMFLRPGPSNHPPH